MLVTGSGSGARPGSLRLGHFAAARWKHAVDHARLPEVFIGGEGLERGAGPVLATLLHEAAHSVAAVRGIKDTSRQGRYHNGRFKAIAEELGLVVTRVPVIGWSATRLAESTAEAYGGSLSALEQAITVHRRQESARNATGPSRNGIACLCACPRRIRVARSVLATGAILCALCGEPFRPNGEACGR